jgi:hypothetical protein
MRYTVQDKSVVQHKEGSVYELRMGSRDPVYDYSILSVTAHDFDRAKIGDTIEILITILPSDPPIAA